MEIKVDCVLEESSGILKLRLPTSVVQALRLDVYPAVVCDVSVGGGYCWLFSRDWINAEFERREQLRRRK